MRPIIIDFDDTIAYGRKDLSMARPVPLAIETIQELRSKSVRMRLWTCRGSDERAELERWLLRHQIKDCFEHINETCVWQRGWSDSPKPYGMLIDNHALGCPLLPDGRTVDWNAVRVELARREYL